MTLDWIYSDVVKYHFTNTRNVLIEDESSFPADGRGQTGNIKCGDQMLVLLKIKDDIITDVRWKTYRRCHCLHQYAIGSCQGNENHCSVLGDKALRTAIDDYLDKTGRQGLFKEPATIICQCIGITDKDIEAAFQQGGAHGMFCNRRQRWEPSAEDAKTDIGIHA